MSEQPKDVGQFLKKERENKGLSLDMVHEATKIPIDSLKAIEEGYKVRTLTSFYYKSFVRIYSQHLNIDPDPLIAQISSEPPRKKFEPRRPEPVSKKVNETISLNLFTRPLRSKKSMKILKIVGAAVIAVAVVAVLVSLVVGIIRKVRLAAPAQVASVMKVEKKKAQKETKKEKTASVLPAENTKKAEEKRKLDVARSAENVKPAEAVKPVEPPKKIEPSKPVEAKPVEAKPVSSETRAMPVKSSQESAAPRLGKKISVSVRAINNSWLIVRTDGSIVFQATLKKGTSESWSANKVIDISGKEIDQLEFEINGKPVPRLSRRGAPAKKIRITPEGLTVEK